MSAAPPAPSEIDRVVEILGGPRALGSRPTSEVDLISVVRGGVPFAAFQRATRALELTLGDIEESLGLSARSLHRRKKTQRLTKTESELIMRLVRVVARAEHVLGARDAALEWMETPNRALRGETPLALLDTEIGSKRVLDLLGRIEHGVYT